MKYAELFFYGCAWLASLIDLPLNLSIGLISVGLMWKCAWELDK